MTKLPRLFKLLPVIVLLACAALTSCSHAPREQTGKVLDELTKQPIEGAFVLATYSECGGTPFGHSSCWCESTRGVFTGPDGAFRFPVVDKKGRSLSFPTAIKPGYRYVEAKIVNYEKQSTDRDLFWKDQNVILGSQKRDEPQLNFQSYEANCLRAVARQDAAAGMQFLRFELAELEKFGGAQEWLDDMWGRIMSLDKLPDAAGTRLVYGSEQEEKAVWQADKAYIARREEAKAAVDATRRATVGILTILATPTTHFSCVSIDGTQLTPDLLERLDRAGIRYLPPSAHRGDACVAIEEVDEVVRHARALLREFEASQKSRVRRYPRETMRSAAEAQHFEFSEAVVRNDVARAKTMLAQGANPHERITTDLGDFFYQPPLVVATRQGYAEMVELLVASGADVNIRGSYGNFSLLELARNYEQFDARTQRIILDALLTKSANPNVVSKGNDAPLTLAVERGQAELVRRLIAAGADVNISAGSTGTPMAAAARFYSYQVSAGSSDSKARAKVDQFCDIMEQLVAAGAIIPSTSNFGPIPEVRDAKLRERLVQMAAERAAKNTAK